MDPGSRTAGDATAARTGCGPARRSVLGAVLPLAAAGCSGAGPSTSSTPSAPPTPSAPSTAATPSTREAPSRPPGLGHALLPTAAGRPLPHPLRGVTVDTVDRLDDVVAAVAAHRATPTVRIVFDAESGPSAYAEAVRRLRPHAYLLGTLLDSTAVEAHSVSQVTSRTRAFARALGERIDVWEVGNEVNGEWLGTPAAITAKVAAAYDTITAELAPRRPRTAVTLSYWPSADCYAKPWEATLPFARQLPARVRAGATLALLSFYESACDPPAHPGAGRIASTLRELGRVFPAAGLGMGEVGAQGVADGMPRDPTPAHKRAIAERYYGMQAALGAGVGPRFVGGWFWWYYVQDAVPRGRADSLWPTLDRLLSRL